MIFHPWYKSFIILRHLQAGRDVPPRSLSVPHSNHTVFIQQSIHLCVDVSNY